MQSIRTNFQTKIETTLSNAVGTSVVLQIGVHHHAVHAKRTPNARLFVGVGPPGEAGSRAVQAAPTHRAIHQLLKQNGNILYELHLAELVQHWFDFLSDLYQKIISEKLRRSANYTPPKTKIHFDFDDASNDVITHIEEMTQKEFDFLNADEKLKAIRKSLNVDLSSYTQDEMTIRANVKIRNISQHGLGIVDASDLRKLGISSFQVDQGGAIDQVGVGQRITRTAFDLENLVGAMTNISGALVP